MGSYRTQKEWEQYLPHIKVLRKPEK